CLEKVVHPVPGLEAPRENDEGVARIEPPGASGARHRLPEPVEIHGIGGEVDALAAFPETREPFPQGGGDAEHRISPPGEEALDLNGHPDRVDLAIAGLLLD